MLQPSLLGGTECGWFHNFEKHTAIMLCYILINTIIFMVLFQFTFTDFDLITEKPFYGFSFSV